MNRAVFLDRDGTLIEEREYLRDPEKVALFPGVPEALQRLRQAGYKLVIVTNQSGIGRGYFTWDELEQVHRRMLQLLAPHQVCFDKIYIAPEAPGQPSRGRKPSPQFLFDAQHDLQIDLKQSFIVGDKWIDLETGWNAGVTPLLVRTGYGAQMEKKDLAPAGPLVIVDDLLAAAEWILSQPKS